MPSEERIRPALSPFLQAVRQDVRFSFRLFGSDPSFTLVAVFSLALGIAACATVFSWIDGVLLHSYPGVHDTRGLALIETVGEPLATTSYLDYRDYRDGLERVGEVAVGRITAVSVGGADGNAERGWAELVSANYFDVLRVKPTLGRTFLAEEGADKPGGFPVAVISYRMWQSRYHGDPGVLGTPIRLNRHWLTIIGVAPPRFRGSTVGFAYDVWMPITMAEQMGNPNTLNYRGCRDLSSTLVRLAPGVRLEQARAAVSALGQRLAAAYPDTNRGIGATVVPVWAGRLGAQGLLAKPLGILMAVSVLLLLVVCANVANLLLARTVSRQKEFAIRFAHGAERNRLVRQLLTETLLLVAGGAAVGLLAVSWMGQSLNRLLPPVDFPFELGGRLSWPTLAFTLVVVVAVTVASGLAPALLSLRGDLASALNEGGRSDTGGPRSQRLRKLLVAGEIAFAVVALSVAGLFLRSFRNANRIEPGFETRNVLVAQFYLSNAGYTAQEQGSFCRVLRERIQTLPGVLAATYADFVPLTSIASSPRDRLAVDGYVPAPGEPMRIPRATVSPGYFEMMGIRLVGGRDFTEGDAEGAPPVMIVNESFARRFFAGASPVGRRIQFAGQPVTVVAEVRDSKYDTPLEASAPYFYLPFHQRFAPGLNFSFLIKTAGDPPTIVPELRRQALALNPDAVFKPARLEDAIGYSLYVPKVAASLLTVVGAVCLLLVALGLYSVTSYAVSQRTREFGIRLTLGASPWSVVRMVVRESLALAIPGVIAGTVAALVVANAVGSMLVGIRVTDPLTFGGSALFLLSVTVLASYGPARRAVRGDPMGHR